MLLNSSIRSGSARSSTQYWTRILNKNFKETSRTNYLKQKGSSWYCFSSNSSIPNHDDTALEQRRREIFEAALKHVPACGWTDDALAQGVLDAGYPPASIGLVSTNGGGGDLVSFHMHDCAEKFEKQLHLQLTEMENKTYAEKLEHAIRTRLEMNISLVRAKRWHEGMATGTLQGPTTAQQLETICQIIQTFVNDGNDGGVLERAAIGSIYLGTELHMLMDEDLSSFAMTWEFLRQRVSEFDNMSLPSSTPEIHTAATAVISSLGGATISLLQPAMKVGVGSLASTIVPVFMNLMQQQPSMQSGYNMNTTHGTKAQDYTMQAESSDNNLDSLPPFDNEKSGK